MNFSLRPFLSLAFILTTCVGSAQFSEVERSKMREALFMANLAQGDLGFDRAAFAIEGALPRVTSWQNNPLSGVESLLSFRPAKTNSVASWIQLVGKERWSEYRGSRKPSVGIDTAELSKIPDPYRGVIAALSRDVATASAEIRLSLDKLSPDERRQLIESLPVLLTPAADVKFDFVRQPPLAPAQAWLLLSKVDHVRLHSAAEALAEATDEAVSKLAQIDTSAPFVGLAKLNLGGLVLVFAGVGSNEHFDRDAVLTIDLGGDDVYRGRHGAGVGYASVLIDMGGDDRYEVPDLSIGASVLGVGLAVDVSGRDTYDGKSLCFGAGLGGYGVLIDGGGRDQFTATCLAQGFGIQGAGILADSAGHDIYLLASYGQGCASIGGIGVVHDAEGNDVFRAVGSLPRPKVNPSFRGCFAQAATASFDGENLGLASGMGCLSDLGGNDIYVATTRAQGYGESMGLGFLDDRAGDDTYRLEDSGQAFGNRAGIGVLTDISGNDMYFGGEGQGLGSSTDFGAAWFWDRSGNDLYASTYGRPAVAINGSLAVFFDGEGNDRYQCTIAQTNSLSSMASVSVFADFNGEDRYQEGLEDGISLVFPGLGVAADFASLRRSTSLDDPAQTPPTAGSAPDPGPTKLGELYEALAVTQDPTVRTAKLNELMAIGLPAVQWCLSARLGQCQSQDRFFIGSLVNHVGAEARNLLAFKIADRNDSIALDALLICGEFQFKEAGPTMAGALERERLSRMAARYAGSFGELAAVPALMLACANPDPRTVAYALHSLAELADPQSVGTGQALLGSKNPLVRHAAAELVARFPDVALPAADGLILSIDEGIARTGVALLGNIASKDALDRLGKLLTDSRSGVRIEALLALHRRCPLEYRTTFLNLRNDPDPRVKLVARRVNPGS